MNTRQSDPPWYTAPPDRHRDPTFNVPPLLRVSYLGQNKAFAAAMPKTGLLGRQMKCLSLRGLGENWSLVKLTEPFRYHDRRHWQILLKSRWKDHEVGTSPKTSVFILLCADAALQNEEELESADCDLVAWGMAETVPLAALTAHEPSMTSLDITRQAAASHRDFGPICRHERPYRRIGPAAPAVGFRHYPQIANP